MTDTSAFGEDPPPPPDGPEEGPPARSGRGPAGRLCRGDCPARGHRQPPSGNERATATTATTAPHTPRPRHPGHHDHDHAETAGPGAGGQRIGRNRTQPPTSPTSSRRPGGTASADECHGHRSDHHERLLRRSRSTSRRLSPSPPRLHLPPTAVKPLTLAVPVADVVGSGVVVVIGADLAPTSGSTTTTAGAGDHHHGRRSLDHFHDQEVMTDAAGMGGPVRPLSWPTRPRARCSPTSTARWPPSWLDPATARPLPGARETLADLGRQFRHGGRGLRPPGVVPGRTARRHRAASGWSAPTGRSGPGPTASSTATRPSINGARSWPMPRPGCRPTPLPGCWSRTRPCRSPSTGGGPPSPSPGPSTAATAESAALRADGTRRTPDGGAAPPRPGRQGLGRRAVGRGGPVCVLPGRRRGRPPRLCRPGPPGRPRRYRRW